MRRCLIYVLMLTLVFWLAACGTSSHSTPTPGTGGNGGSGGNGGGGGSSSPTVVALAYGLGGSNSIYGVRAMSDNTLAAVSGSPFTASSAGSVAVRNNLLFVAGNSVDGPTSITSYKLDANGVPTQASSTPTSSAVLIAVDSTGKYLYVTGYSTVGRNDFVSSSVFGYTVDSNANLTPIPGSPWALMEGDSISNIAISPTGSSICVKVGEGHGDANIDCYARNSDGSIDVNSWHVACAGATGTNDVAISNDGRWVYGAGSNDNLIYYGSTSSANTTDARISNGGFPASVATHPTAAWLAVANHDANTISILKIGASGAPVAATSAAAPGGPVTVRFSQDGKYLFATTGGGMVAYSFDASSGNLTLLSGAPVGNAQEGWLAAQ